MAKLWTIEAAKAVEPYEFEVGFDESIKKIQVREQLRKLPNYSFETAQDFYEFLEKKHATAEGIFLRLAKKKSHIKSIAPDHAVEVALCFGWIDGKQLPIDENWWAARYTPRRPKSIWSQKNKQTCGRLIGEGRMRPAGLAEIEKAKVNGNWDRAYGSNTFRIPVDLSNAFKENEAAEDFFSGENMKAVDKYTMLWRIDTETTPATRAKLVEDAVKQLAEGKVPILVPETAIIDEAGQPNIARNKTEESSAGTPVPGKRATKRKTLAEPSMEDTVHMKHHQPRRVGLRARN